MKINISTIENNSAISEVQSMDANGIIGGETNISLEWNSRTSGEDSGQDVKFTEIYALPGGTQISFSGDWWS